MLQHSSMEEEVSKLVRKHLELLQLEREEDLQHFFKNASPAALHNLEQNGQALTKLLVSSFAGKGLQRCQIDFAKADGLPLQHVLGLGDTVFCIPHTRKGPILKALVSAVSETTISVASNDEFEAPEEEEQFSIVKTDSDFTYRCQIRALKNLEKREVYSWRCFDVVRILFEKDSDLARSLLTTEIPIPKSCLDSDEKLMFADANLAEDQKAAVEFILRRKNMAIVQGPPGTGKTTTIVEAIVQLSRLGKKLLVCAPTNVAVDNLVTKLSSTEVKPLRLGHPTRIKESARKYSLDANIQLNDGYVILQDIKKSMKDAKENPTKGKESNPRQIRDLDKEYRQRMNKLTQEVLRKHSVILCTLNSAMTEEGTLRHLGKNYFDVLVVDEASQALEASSWIAIPNAEKLVLTGDINQLPPVVMCQEAVNRGLNISLMERAIKKLGDDSFVSLRIQYRMNRKIMSWSNQQFYHGKLEAHSSVANRLLKDVPTVEDVPVTADSLLFIDTCGCDCEEYYTGIATISKGNMGEAVVVDGVVASLVKAGVSPEDIGVITPYALQVDFIRKLLATRSITAEVSTVDGFQGREKEAIILSLVRSNEQKELGFVTDFRRLNVAVTRAKRLLAVIADSETMEDNKLIAGLLKHVEAEGVIQTAQEYLNENSEELKDRLQNGIKVKQKSEPKSTVRTERVEKTEKSDFKQPRKGETSGIKDRGIDLSVSFNRKNYNPFEEIVQGNEAVEDMLPEEEDCEESPKNDEKESDELSSLIATLNRLKNTSNSGDTNAKGVSEEEPSTSKGESTAKRKKGKSKNKKAEKTKEENGTDDDDFEKVIAAISSENYVCAMDGCKVSTRLIHLSCEFCKRWFCVQHGMQEIHGCGDAVRNKEKKVFRHRKPEPVKQKEKDKFARKLKELQDARKPKKKTTK